MAEIRSENSQQHTEETSCAPRPLSNITEVPSQVTDDRGKETLPLSGSTKRLRSLREWPKPILRASSSQIGIQRAAHQFRDELGSTENHLRGLCAPSDDNSSPAESPGEASASLEDAASPLTASSGRVGSLLLQIHRNRVKALVYGPLFVVTALSHQAWVSGEVLSFNVEVCNSSEKNVKKIELRLERTTSLHTHSRMHTDSSEYEPENTVEVLAKWLWKKGIDGWAGVAPHTRITRIWTPIVPAGQATANTHRVEVRYSLAIFVPCTFSKAATVRIPLTIVSPNSLGASRLLQHLQHSGSSQERLGVQNQKNNKGTKAALPRTPSEGQLRWRAESSYDRSKVESRTGIDENRRRRADQHVYQSLKPQDSSPFVTSNPIPQASTEFLDEMLLRLQKSPKRHFTKRQAPPDIVLRRANSSRSMLRAIPILKPLAAIGAHCKRKSSDDVRQSARGHYVSSNMLKSPGKGATRASFDDYIRPYPYRCSSPSRDYFYQDNNTRAQRQGCSRLGTTNGSEPNLTPAEVEQFVNKRRQYASMRRASANPFFKGSAGKERLMGYRRGLKEVKSPYESRKNIAPGAMPATCDDDSYDYGKYEFRDIEPSQLVDPPSADYESRWGKPFSRNRSGFGQRLNPPPRPSWEYAEKRTLF